MSDDTRDYGPLAPYIGTWSGVGMDTVPDGKGGSTVTPFIQELTFEAAPTLGYGTQKVRAVERALTDLIENLESTEELSSIELFDLVGDSLSSAYAVHTWGIFEIEAGGLRRLNGNFSEVIPDDIWRRYAKKSRPGSEVIGDIPGCLVAPIRPHGKATALLVLGPKDSGDVYTPTDNGLIATLTLEMADKLQAA